MLWIPRDSSLSIILGTARLQFHSPFPCPVSNGITGNTSSDSQNPRLLWVGRQGHLPLDQCSKPGPEQLQ